VVAVSRRRMSASATSIFDSADGYEKGGAASGGVLRADIPNFTNVAPIRQISEILTVG
jgi:hypothetical protein